MQDEKVEMTIAEPEREKISFRLDPDTPAMALALKVKALRDEASTGAQEIRERQQREQEEFSSTFAERNKALFAELLSVLGVEIPVDELSLALDFEYLELHGIAFLNEECPDCGGEGQVLDLGAVLGRLAGQRTQF